MEIKVLGTGCAGCKALYETTKQRGRFIKNHGI